MTTETSGNAATAATSREPEAPLYKGSCHCGFLTYEARIVFERPTAELPESGLYKCNCSYCLKAGIMAIDPSEGSFRLLTPEQGDGRAQSSLPVYKFSAGCVLHPFCPRCGITCYYYGTYEGEDGKSVGFVRVNAHTIDGRADGSPMNSLKDMKLQYWDGKNDAWYNGSKGEPWEGGVW